MLNIVSNFTILLLQKMPTNQLIDLEDRQDKLLLKLDILYERIKNISDLCKIKPVEDIKKNNVNIVSVFFIVIIVWT